MLGTASSGEALIPCTFPPVGRVVVVKVVPNELTVSTTQENGLAAFSATRAGCNPCVL